MTASFNPDLLLKECVFTFLRSSGKGGQHVNKVSTKVELWFDITGSGILDDEQKALIISKMTKNIAYIRMLSGRERSQQMNLKAVTERFVKRVTKLLQQSPVRIKTSPTKASKEERIKNKKAVAGKKSLRSFNPDMD